MLEQEKIKRGRLIAKVLNLKSHSYYGDDDNNIRYDTSWGNKTPLGLYETIQRLLTDDVNKLSRL
jgi:hypothetical protein